MPHGRWEGTTGPLPAPVPDVTRAATGGEHLGRGAS